MELSKRQLDIIKAASKLIGDKGIQNLTMKNLALEMNFSEPALYRHFKDKNEIIVSVLQYYRANMNTAIKEIISSGSNGFERLANIVKFQFNHFHNNPSIVMIIFSETSFQYDESLSKEVLQILNKKQQLIIEVIESGQNDGSIRSDIAPNQLALIVMGTMRLTVLEWHLNGFKDDIVSKGEALNSTFSQLLQ